MGQKDMRYIFAILLFLGCSGRIREDIWPQCFRSTEECVFRWMIIHEADSAVFRDTIVNTEGDTGYIVDFYKIKRSR